MANSRRFLFRALFLVAALAGLPGAVAAQPDNAPLIPSNPESLMTLAVQSLPGTPLPLARALELAVENSTDLGEARAAVLAARGAVRREKGGFDPELFASVTRESNDQPILSPFQDEPVKTDLTLAAGGARMRLPIGTEFEASLNTTRTETNSFFTVLQPQYDTFGLLSVRQPLLAGFGPAAKAGLTSAERALEAAQARYEDTVLRIQADTEGAYWDVYAAERDHAVRALIRDRARIFVTETESRARAGLVGPSAVANAKVFLAEQELAVLDSEEALDGISDRLASILGARPQGDVPRWRTADQPAPLEPAGSVEDLVREAIERNRDIQARRADVEEARARARGAAWDALPELDFVGSLGANGLAGSGPDSLEVKYLGGFGASWDQIWDRDFPRWSVGLELTLPLGRREGRGERDRLRGEAMRMEMILRGSENTLEESVRKAHRELRHGEARLQAARDGVEAALEQVRVGGIEYRNGRTTAFELVRLGADVAASQQRYSQALVSAAKAAAELRYLTSGAYAGASSR